MVQKSENRYLLSVIIPISRMAGRLQNFETTMSNLIVENEIQVIIIHDVQDLNTGPEIRNILNRYPGESITFLEEYIGNPGGARNLGLNYVEGTWVNFVDSDDVYCPLELMDILRMPLVTGVSALISNYEIVDSISRMVTLHDHKKSLTEVALEPGLWRWTFLAKSIGATRFSNLSMGEDQKFLYEFCQQKKKILFTSITTYRYTTNQEFQLTNQSKPKRDLFKVLFEILQIRRSHQTNFDSFTEMIIVKIFISSLIYSTWQNKIKTFLIFFPVLISFNKKRLRYSKLKLRNWS